MKTISKKYVNSQMILFLFTLLVIVWGAWVRISHSGDGCGESWPLCAGEFIPSTGQKKTWIEYAHRLMSGSYGIWVIILFFYTRAKIQSVRLKQWTSILLVLMIIEALLGAKLVLFKLVGTNDSVMRVVAMALHQINSLLLTGATFFIYLTSKHLSQTQKDANSEKTYVIKSIWKQISTSWKFLALGLILVAMVGSWASLSNTLHPSDGLWEGFLKDFSDESHYLVKLRFLHPLLASLLCFSVIIWKMNQYMTSARQHDLLFAGAFAIAFLFGWSTLIFLAPVWMKLVHLIFAHLLWALIISSIFDLSLQGESKNQSGH